MDIQLGSEKLSINPDVFTTTEVIKLRKDVLDLYEEYLNDATERQRKINKIVREYEPLMERQKDDDGEFTETLDELDDRVQELLKERRAKIKALDMTDDDFMEFAFKVLVIIAKVAGQDSKVTKDNFNNAKWSEIQKTLVKILGIHKIAVGELFEPSKSTVK